MRDIFYIAWKYILHHKGKSLTLVASISIIVFLPLGLELILKESEKQLLSRADASPLIVGAKGSALDLCMNTLYFDDEIPEAITMDASIQVNESELATPVPMYVRFKSRGFPVVGTTFDYFEKRYLDLDNGRYFGTLGECVIGNSVAERLGITVDSSIITSPESLFDLAGIYPLKMKVVGILKQSATPDDRAIFVDVKTAWIIEGLGHGHQDVSEINDPTIVINRTDSVVSASAKLFHYNEITEKNAASFHFHGDVGSFPITSVLVFPNDQKSETLLQGRYISKDAKYQIINPTTVIDGLMQNIFRIRNILDSVIAIVAFATLLTIILVFMLSLRLRQKEINTIFKLGCQKGVIAWFMIAELAMIFVMSLFVTGILLIVMNVLKDQIIQMLLYSN